MKVALLQISSSDDPGANLEQIRAQIREGVAGGAQFVLTPEVSNCVSLDRAHQEMVLVAEQDDATLSGLRAEAKRHGIWLSLGSLALKGGEGGRFVNRSFIINPVGEIVARYDKIHMFDVDVSETETYRESSGYAPGSEAVVADIDGVKAGLSICYDVRFPALYRQLAQAGADILLVPSAFSPVTGAAHWETLLRARAIETGCYVFAAAQTGTHPATSGKSRQTYGHSLAISPWGEVLLDAGTETGTYFVEMSTKEVAQARRRIPSLSHDRDFVVRT